MRIRTQWVATAGLVLGLGTAPASGAGWTVAAEYTAVVRVRPPGAPRTSVIRSKVTFAMNATLAADGSYEITGPVRSCESVPGSFAPTGTWRGSERAFLEKAVRETLRVTVKGCGRSLVRLGVLDANVRIAGDALTGRLSATAGGRVPVGRRRPLVVWYMAHGRVTGERR